MPLEIRGDMIGTFTTASLNGTNAPDQELTVSGISPLGTHDDVFYLELFQKPGDTFVNGQFWRLTDAEGNVIADYMIPDNTGYQMMGAGDEHILFLDNYILDLGGLQSTMVYTPDDEIADPDVGNNDGELQISEVEAAVCFGAGSVIRTAQGLVPVELIEQGDLVWTMDHGMQPVAFVARTVVDLRRAGDLAPVEILRGALGRGLPARPVVISPQHRVLLTGHLVELYAGLEEALVPAHWLARGHLGKGRIRRRHDLDQIEYIHLMFDRHEIVDSGGLLSESFHPGAEAVRALDCATRDELYRLFPQFRLFGSEAAGPLCRPEIRGRAAALMSRAA